MIFWIRVFTSQASFHGSSCNQWVSTGIPPFMKTAFAPTLDPETLNGLFDLLGKEVVEAPTRATQVACPTPSALA